MDAKLTLCPLDCYDACRIGIDENGKLKGDKNHPLTRGYLCPNLNHFDEYPRISVPRLHGREVSMDEAIEALCAALKENKPQEVLYYRGSGNMGLMQRSTQHFFAHYGAVGTSGSLCDGAGEAGIKEGRGANYLLSPQMIGKSEVVIIWGRNPHTTHSHLLPYLEGKILVVIDPVKTAAAEKADLHIQIKPHCDLHLALLLSRFVMIEGSHDVEWLEEHAGDYESYYELTQSVRIKATLEQIDVTLGQIGTLLALIQGRRTVILVGAGIQKYRNGADVMRAIDGFGALLGLFGKEGCGVSFLGDSALGISMPFETPKLTASKATVDFSKYNCVFVQGANPLEQMPDSSKVRRTYAEAGFKVYFGIYENETSRSSDLVIPAKTFLEKNDFRSSYGDYTFGEMPKMTDSAIGISEYGLAARLSAQLGIEIPSEEQWLEALRSQIRMHEGVGYRLDAPDIPYENGFESGEFAFLDELDLHVDNGEGFWLITAKHPKGLNSQFYRPQGVRLHPEAGYEEGESVRVHSPFGEIVATVVLDERVRKDTVLIYAGTPDVNVLTPPWISYEGANAAYQEIKIKVEKL